MMRIITLFFQYLLVINIPVAANAQSISHLEKDNLNFLEKKIYQSAKNNGFKKTEITITWVKNTSGDFNAIIKCLNPAKCSQDKIKISFPIEKSSPFTNSAQGNTKFFRGSSLKEHLDSLFRKLETGNEGPGFRSLKQ